MSTSISRTPILSEIEIGAPVPQEKLAYFQERTRNRLHTYVLRKFIEKERGGKLTRAELARRIGKRPEQVTRMLGAPGNWTIGTISDLLIGIAAEELEPKSVSLLGRSPRNYRRAQWLSEPDDDNPVNHPIIPTPTESFSDKGTGAWRPI